MLDSATWPRARLGEAVRALARRAGMEPGDEIPLAPPVSGELSSWIEAAARFLRVESVPVEVPYPELGRFLRDPGPAILELDSGSRFLAVVRGTRRHLVVLTEGGLDLRVSRRDVAAALVPEADAGVEKLLANVPLSSRRKTIVARELLREELRDRSVTGVWLVRMHPGARSRGAMRQARLPSLVAVFASAHAIDYGLFILSWWLVGRGALAGHIDMGWLYAWALLFLTMLPFRSLSTWYEGRIAVAAGSLLKQRLLVGAMRLAPDELRSDGAGRHLARVFESEAVESLALAGGMLSAAAGIELLGSLAVISLGAGGLVQTLLLAGTLGVFAITARGYYVARKRWTDERLSMSHDLVERMVGHRTRLAQQRVESWHEGEDAALASYMQLAADMDRRHAFLGTIYRFWHPVGLLGLAPPFVRGTATFASFAVGLGGLILAGRALQKLRTGLPNLLDAVIAWQRVAPTFHAAERTPAPGDPALVTTSSGNGRVLLEASDLAFRYPSRTEPVLGGVRFSVERGDQVLLTSPSGGGKSTLVSLLNGLREPVSGLLLLDGVDRASLGAERWARRVATAPQFHENHVFTESFGFNLLMGRKWPPDDEDWEEAEAVCRELGLGDLLEKMPGGMTQLVGDTGWQLSHGERSRLFLARALLQGGDITLLDESFAALDPDNLRHALVCARRRAESLVVVAHL